MSHDHTVSIADAPPTTRAPEVDDALVVDRPWCASSCSPVKHSAHRRFWTRRSCLVSQCRHDLPRRIVRNCSLLRTSSARWRCWPVSAFRAVALGPQRPSQGPCARRCPAPRRRRPDPRPAATASPISSKTRHRSSIPWRHPSADVSTWSALPSKQNAKNLSRSWRLAFQPQGVFLVARERAAGCVAGSRSPIRFRRTSAVQG